MFDLSYNQENLNYEKKSLVISMWYHLSFIIKPSFNVFSKYITKDLIIYTKLRLMYLKSITFKTT